MRNICIILFLFALLAACSSKPEQTEKEVKVEMKMLNDSTAEATVTISEDSAGTKKETQTVIKGKPEEVRQQVDSKK